MNIQVKEELDGDPAFNEFICHLIIDGLTAAVMAVAPELAGTEVFENIEFEAMCDQ